MNKCSFSGAAPADRYTYDTVLIPGMRLKFRVMDDLIDERILTFYTERYAKTVCRLLNAGLIIWTEEGCLSVVTTAP
jgi:hypothetical protein